MKKIHTLLVLILLVPTFALAAPKQRITMPFLKKQVASLTNENKALRAELDALKALQTKTSNELAFCRQNPVIEYRQAAQPQFIYTPVVVSNPDAPKRKANITAYPITDKIEVNGLHTVINAGIQLQGVTVDDKIDLLGTTIVDSYFENGSKFYVLPPESVKLTLTINGNTFFPEIVVYNTPDMGSNSNKKVQLVDTLNIEI